MTDVVSRVRNMPAMKDIERITGRGPDLYSLTLKDDSVVLCTRGAYRRLFEESREEKEQASPADVARVKAAVAQEKAEEPPKAIPLGPVRGRS